MRRLAPLNLGQRIVAVVGIVLIAAWAVISIWLLGLPSARDTDSGSN